MFRRRVRISSAAFVGGQEVALSDRRKVLLLPPHPFVLVPTVIFRYYSGIRLRPLPNCYLDRFAL